MKRWIVAVMCLALCLSLVACGGSSDNQDSSGGDTQQQTQTNTPNDAPEDNETNDEGAEEQQSNSADLGDYHVEIKSAALAQDYEGNPALVVTYSWTNNSEDTTSAMVSVSCSAFQNGVGLESAIIMDDSVYDSDSFMTDVRPGTTIDVQSAFLLGDTTSVVEVEVGEWVTFESDPPIARMDFDPSTL